MKRSKTEKHRCPYCDSLFLTLFRGENLHNRNYCSTTFYGGRGFLPNRFVCSRCEKGGYIRWQLKIVDEWIGQKGTIKRSYREKNIPAIFWSTIKRKIKNKKKGKMKNEK